MVNRCVPHRAEDTWLSRGAKVAEGVRGTVGEGSSSAMDCYPSGMRSKTQFCAVYQQLPPMQDPDARELIQEVLSGR